MGNQTSAQAMNDPCGLESLSRSHLKNCKLFSLVCPTQLHDETNQGLHKQLSCIQKIRSTTNMFHCNNKTLFQHRIKTRWDCKRKRENEVKGRSLHLSDPSSRMIIAYPFVVVAFHSLVLILLFECLFHCLFYPSFKQEEPQKT